MLNFSIEFMDLVKLVFIVLGVAALSVVIMTFINLNKTIKRIDKILEKNDENINKTMALIPEVTNNVNQVSIGIIGVVQKVDTAVDGFEETVSTVTETTEGIVDFISIAVEVFKSIFQMFPNGKRR